MDSWKAKIIQYVVSILLGLLTPEMLKKFVDMLLDFIENTVAGTTTDIDDKLLLPLCDLIRTTFNIPDNDQPPA